MVESRITWQRRQFVEILSSSDKVTFSYLKSQLVGKGEGKMDTTTLYRIIDAFKSEGLIHEMKVAGERIIFACTHPNATKHDAITLSICENCGSVFDEHVLLPQNIAESTTYLRLKSCPNCVIK